jgi:hypothetical protein
MALGCNPSKDVSSPIAFVASYVAAYKHPFDCAKALTAATYVSWIVWFDPVNVAFQLYVLIYLVSQKEYHT